MRLTHPLPLFLALASIFASSAALAEEWHVCVATSGNPEGDNRHVHWAVTQPFEVSAIADWRAQFEQAKSERYAFASSRGWGTNDFICTDAAADQATAQGTRDGILQNFESRRETGAQLGLPFSWEDWSWRPSDASVAANASGDDGAAASDDAAGEQSAGADDAAAAAEARRQQDLAAAKLERDRLAAEKAKLEKEIADARRERDRLAAEEQKRKQAASTDTDANRCVTSPELRQNDTFQGNTAAYVTNGCGTPVDVRICLMKENGVWNCGMTYGLAPQKSWSWSSMKATGQTFMDARVAGSSRQMASP